MVKINPKASAQVTKDLLGKRGKKKGVNKKALKVQAKAEKENGVVPKENGSIVELPAVRNSDEPANTVTRGRWRNKQRVIIFGSRGIPHKGRHLMNNLLRLLPHGKKDSKMDKRDTLFSINEIAEMKNCNKVLFFEARKNQDIYMWMAEIGKGPSVKFLVENMSTMEELKFSGNCLKGSRAILSFDPTFDTAPQWQVMKDLLAQTFGTPYHHPKSQPFIDHVITFTVLDNRIWFRNFQIIEEDGSLVEIGPRFTLNPIRLFEGSFVGQTLWNNTHYVSPNSYRSMLKKAQAGKYKNKVMQKQGFDARKPDKVYPADPSSEVFETTADDLNSD